MDRYDVERAVEKGIRKGLKDEAPMTASSGGLLLMGILALLPVLLMGLFHNSWIVFVVGFAIIGIGFMYYQYILAVFTPIAYEYALFMFTLKDFKEDGIEFTMGRLIFDFFKETWILFFVCLAIGMFIAYRFRNG